MLLSFVANWSVVLLCVGLKLPQILSVVRGGSAKGLSTYTGIAMIYCYSIGTVYGYVNDFPIKNYIESTLLLIQEIILFWLTCSIQGQRSLSTLIPAAGLYGILMSALLSNIFPVFVLDALIFAVTPISAVGKMTQSFKLFKEGESGNVSATTWGLLAYGCLVRFFTSLFEVKSMILAFSYGLSLLQNGLVFAQIQYYKKWPRQKKRTF